MPSALVVWGGWDGHAPKDVAEVFRKMLSEEGYAVEVSNTLDALKDEAKLLSLDLIVPCWTMGKISSEQFNPLAKAVASGVGLAGVHGGMGDAFREHTEYQFMVGGQFVSHPGGGQTKYKVYLKDPTHPITKGLPDFDVVSEQYYMHVDPCIKVLGSTTFPTAGADSGNVPNGFFEMPQIWTKLYGKGRVFYSAIGHDVKVLTAEPHLTLLRRGCLWAAAGKREA